MAPRESGEEGDDYRPRDDCCIDFVDMLATDGNSNEVVAAGDYATWKLHFGQTNTGSGDVQGSGWDMLAPFRVAIPGDNDGNGTVDAADYVVWRKNPGGIYTPDDYNTWRANFGQSFVTGMGSSASGSTSAFAQPRSPAVPEPTSFALLMFAAAGWSLRRGRTA